MKLTLKQCRTLTGMTEDEMAKGVGVSTITLYHWEQRTKSPTLRQYGKILSFLKERGLPLTVDDITFLPDEQTA